MSSISNFLQFILEAEKMKEGQGLVLMLYISHPPPPGLQPIKAACSLYTISWGI